MKKTSIMALLLACAVAAFAQTTAEKIISLMPELPSEIYDALYAIGKEADYAMGDVFPAQAAVLCLEQPEEIEEYGDVLEEEEK